MDFGRSPEEAAFADEVRRFLAEQPPERFPLDGVDTCYGSGAHSHAFMRALGVRGWLAMGWPEVFFGQAWLMLLLLVLLEERSLAVAQLAPLAGSLLVVD